MLSELDTAAPAQTTLLRAGKGRASEPHLVPDPGWTHPAGEAGDPPPKMGVFGMQASEQAGGAPRGPALTKQLWPPPPHGGLHRGVFAMRGWLEILNEAGGGPLPHSKTPAAQTDLEGKTREMLCGRRAAAGCALLSV